MSVSDEKYRENPNDRKYEDTGSGLTTFLKAHAGVVGVLGASTALFHFSMYSSGLSKKFSHIDRFLTRASERLPVKNLSDYTISDFKGKNSVQQTLLKTWKDTKEELKKMPDLISLHDPNELLGQIEQVRQFEKDPSRFIENTWRQSRLYEPTKNWYLSKAATLKHDEQMQRRFVKFIEQASHQVQNNAYQAKILKQSGFLENEAQHDVASAIISKIRKLNAPRAEKSLEYESFKINKEKEMEGVKRLFHNVDNLVEMQKARASKFDKFFLSILKKITGKRSNHKITVGEALEDKNYALLSGTINNIHTKGEKGVTESVNPLEALKELREELAKGENGAEAVKKFNSLILDSHIRIDSKGEIYSTKTQDKFLNNLISSAASTLPGKILKLRDIQYNRLAPAFYYSAKGSKDPILAAMVNDTKNRKDLTLDKDIFRIYDKIYTLNKKQELEELDVGETMLVSGLYGATQRLIHQMAGDTRYAVASNSFQKWHDIATDREEFGAFNPLKKIKSIFTKGSNENYILNEIEAIIDPTATQEKEYRDAVAAISIIGSHRGHEIYAINQSAHIDKVYSLLKNNTYKLSDKSIQALQNTFENEESQVLLEILKNKDDAELVEHFMKHYSDYDYDSLNIMIKNKELRDLRDAYATDAQAALRSITRSRDKSGAHITSDITDIASVEAAQVTHNFADTLRKELGKEALLQELGNDYEAFYKKIKSATNEEVDRRDIKRLADLAIFEKYSNVNASPLIQSEEAYNNGGIDVWSRIEEVHDFFHDNKKTQTAAKEVKETLQALGKENYSPLSTFYEEADEIANPISFNSFITIKKRTGVMDIISDLNSWTKTKGHVGDLWQEVLAGRNDLKNVSYNTLTPYFFLYRLSNDANALGIGFSKANMGSTWDIAKGIVLKRALPLAIGIGYFDWLDDTSQEITGMSISGAMAQGIANTDLTFRKGLDFLGLTDWLKQEKQVNPIMQYWGDKNEFRSYEEQKEYYESGYDPVRKGAWWTFGGVNEARGGEIQYWQPSFVRRIQSDYLDKSLYGSYFEKWSHSWLPTPTNPLAPIINLLDPYWLEEKHKDDRPYLLTGKLFGEGTPWSAVLNNTIGDIIKPQKDLHTVGEWLPFTDGFHYRNINGIDPKSLLHAMNSYIKQKAQDLSGTNMIQIKGSNITPVNFIAYDAPTEDSAVLSAQIGNVNLDGSLAQVNEGVYGVYDYTHGPYSRGVTSLGRGNGGGSGTGVGSLGVGGSSGSGNSDQELFLWALNNENNVSLKDKIKNVLFNEPIRNTGATIGTDKNGNIAIFINGRLNKDVNSIGDISKADEIMIDKIVNGDTGNIKGGFAQILNTIDPRQIIQSANRNILARAENNSSYGYSVGAARLGAYNGQFDDTQGIIIGDKLKNYRPTAAMDLLKDADVVTDLINTGKGNSLVREAAVSWRLISGIYGYGLGAMTGIGSDNEKRIATSGDIDSYTRAFWDSNVGGAGGNAMEIIRRFIPNFRRSARINPLMNEMPDWLPDRFRYSDPFTLIVHGEMRLPGKGYEALNDLHPDQFGRHNCRIKNVRIAENSLELWLLTMRSDAA